MLVGNIEVSFISEAYTSPYNTDIIFWIVVYVTEPVPVAARSKAKVCGRSPAEIVG